MIRVIKMFFLSIWAFFFKKKTKEPKVVMEKEIEEVVAELIEDVDFMEDFLLRFEALEDNEQSFVFREILKYQLNLDEEEQRLQDEEDSIANRAAAEREIYLAETYGDEPFLNNSRDSWNNGFSDEIDQFEFIGMAKTMIQNSIMTLHPYKSGHTWMFDDDATGLVREAFVSGIDTMIEALVEQKGLDNPEGGFDLIFSKSEFPTHDIKITHMSEEDNKYGNWYWSEDLQIRGWLCPALFKYFATAPKEIYAEVR